MILKSRAVSSPRRHVNHRASLAQVLVFLLVVGELASNGVTANEAARGAAARTETQMGIGRSTNVGRLSALQPVMNKPYPFEYLLDEDYIHDSANPLDNWPTTTKPPPTSEATTPPTTTTTTTTTRKPAPAPVKLTPEPSGCVTVEPKRAAWFAKTAPAGSRCVFGADPRDEGYHCIFDDPSRHGTFGWCWTKTDKSEWGSCGEQCPLFGQDAKLRNKLLRAQASLNAWKGVLAKNRGVADPAEAAVAAQVTAAISDIIGEEPASQTPLRSQEPVTMKVVTTDKEAFPAVIALPAVASLFQKLAVGQSVELVSNFDKFSDAKDGPLRMGARDKIEGVSARGRCMVQNWWYDRAALQPVTFSPTALSPVNMTAVSSSSQKASLPISAAATVSVAASAVVSLSEAPPPANSVPSRADAHPVLVGLSPGERHEGVKQRHREMVVTTIEDLPAGNLLQT